MLAKADLEVVAYKTRSRLPSQLNYQAYKQASSLEYTFLTYVPSVVCLDPFVIKYLYILECSKSLRPFSCLLRPFSCLLRSFHVYKFTYVLIGLNNKQ